MKYIAIPVALLTLAAAPAPLPEYRIVSLSETTFPKLSPYHWLRDLHQTACEVDVPAGVPVPTCLHFVSRAGIDMHVPVANISTLGGGRFALRTEHRYAFALGGTLRITAEHHGWDLNLVGKLGAMPW